MNLVGKFTNGSEEYLLCRQTSNKFEIFLLYSQYTREDAIALAMGKAIQSPKLETITALQHLDGKPYLIGGIKKSRTTGVVKSYGNINELRVVLDELRFAKTYAFRKEDITYNDEQVILGTRNEQFSAEDNELRYLYEKENDEYTLLRVRHGAFGITLSKDCFFPSTRGLSFEEVSDATQNAIAKATLENITYKDLANVLDMSWYRRDDVVVKDYRVVHSIAEFEAMYAELVEDALATEDRLYIAIDTETTGTNIFDLSKDNPARDHGVAISISWKDNQGYVIFNDMEYFSGLPAEYCFKRFAEIFTEGDDGNITVTWTGGSKILPRNKFWLIGQNSPFDRRVSISEGHPIWYNDDTLNMAFNINPKVVRGNNGLKNLTRRLFGHETPELSDVLGKGNEDKYRYLANEEVAKIYACADSDYTRMVFFRLRELLGQRMYAMYHKQDVRMLNILAVSEYHGLTTQAEDVQVLGEQSFQNLRILREAAYSYIGAYMSFSQELAILKSQYDTGLLTDEEFAEGVKNVHPDKDASYEFEFKGSDIREVMFDILKYPPVSFTDTGLPKVDKYTRKKLLQVKRTDKCTARKLNKSILVYGADYAEYERLCAGTEAQKKKAKAMELINKDKFNDLEYPLALLFEQYAVLNKEFTSYFEPIRKQNLEGKLFKTYSLSRIETRRIMNPSQTMKKNLKELIIPCSDDYYMVDFDLSQIELRLMYSLSPSPVLIEKMKNPEADGHTENAAMVNHKPAYKVTTYERKGAKSVSFGVPYGLGDLSLCETIFKDQTPEHQFETRMILYKWKQANAPIVDMLEAARDGALVEVQISKEKRDFMDAYQRDPETKAYLLDDNGEKIPMPLGAVYNKLGFCRYFDLTGIDQSPAAKRRRASGSYTSAESTIRRAAGNYPIQSYAAEFFRLILYRFYDRCKKYGIANKVVWHMLIHDELLCSVHKSVNPILMYKIIKEACMITMPGHTKYFVGINIGDNWEQTKDDSREAPVIFVQRMIERYDAGEFNGQKWFDHPWDFIKPYRDAYIRDRIHEVLQTVQPDIDSAPINLPLIFDKFDNYTVRAYVNDYPLNSPVDKSLKGSAEDDAIYSSKFETWALSVFGEGKQIIGLDDKLYKLHKCEQVQDIPVDDDFLDDDDDSFIEDEYELYDFDEEGIVDNYFAEAEPVSSLEELSFDLDNYGDYTDVAQMTLVERKYQNIKVLNGCIVITIDNEVQEQFLRKTIQVGKGSAIMFKCGNASHTWQRAADTIDLSALDIIITKIRSLPSCVIVMRDNLIIHAKNNEQVQCVRKFVTHNKGFGYKVMIRDVLGRLTPAGQVRVDASFEELEV